MKDEFISIREAAKRGIERLRVPEWASCFDHLKIDIINGEPGPWIHFYSPFTQGGQGKKETEPYDILYIEADYDESVYVPYLRPNPEDDEEYKKELKYWSKYANKF